MCIYVLNKIVEEINPTAKLCSFGHVGTFSPWHIFRPFFTFNLKEKHKGLWLVIYCIALHGRCLLYASASKLLTVCHILNVLCMCTVYNNSRYILPAVA